MLHDDLAVADPADDEEAPILQDGDAGKRRVGEAFPIRREAARLQAQFLGAAQHLGHADGAAGETVAELIEIGADALEAQQHDERAETAVAGAGSLSFGLRVHAFICHRRAVFQPYG